MSHVWDAMKKHEAEETERRESAEALPPDKKKERPAVKGANRAGRTPVIGTTDHYAEVLAAHHDRGGAITEQFRALRTHLIAHYADKRFVTMITSAEAGEGKTVTCINLGIVLTERTERTTLIIDCDLRKSKIASHLNVENSPGMAELIRGSAAVDATVQPTVYPNLFVLPAGNVERREVGELVGKPELHEIIAQLRPKYDYVLLDAPPVNRAADAGMLGQAADGALLVVRMHKTHRESVDRAIRLLHSSNVTVSGLVLTHQKFYIPSYLYRYS